MIMEDVNCKLYLKKLVDWLIFVKCVVLICEVLVNNVVVFKCYVNLLFCFDLIKVGLLSNVSKEGCWMVKCGNFNVCLLWNCVMVLI